MNEQVTLLSSPFITGCGGGNFENHTQSAFARQVTIPERTKMPRYRASAP
jgi:hypothetical protein